MQIPVRSSRSADEHTLALASNNVQSNSNIPCVTENIPTGSKFLTGQKRKNKIEKDKKAEG